METDLEAREQRKNDDYLDEDVQTLRTAHYATFVKTCFKD
jgi:hypothetical protein